MIAAVVVTHSAPAAVLRRCLDALLATPELSEIVVVANGPAADLAPDAIGPDRTVRLLVVDNRGYGAAANAGIAHVADASAVVVMNDDVVVQPGWLSPLADALDDPGVGVAQPVLVSADHDVVVSCGVQIDRFGAGSDIGDGGPRPSGAPVDLELFTGGSALFDREFLRSTGGFDERLFLYYEDVDLARRGRALGWTYRLVPDSVVEHRRGTTTGGDADRTRYLQERNRLWHAFRWESPATAARACWLSVRRLRHRPRRLHARALAAGLGRAPAAVVERLRDRG